VACSLLDILSNVIVNVDSQHIVSSLTSELQSNLNGSCEFDQKE
jgi:hypothetical protein